MTRKECLDMAMACVCGQRDQEYGSPEDCFERIAALWSAYLNHAVHAHDVGAMMVLLKVARFKANPMHLDSAVDCAGYAACMAETATAWGEEQEEARADRRFLDGVFGKYGAKCAGNCCQNGNSSPATCAEPEFGPAPKDKGFEELAMADAEEIKNAFGKPDGGGEGQFKNGDPVEVLPVDGEWERATYRYAGTRNGLRGCWVSDADSCRNMRFVPDCGIRPVQTPKAEDSQPEALDCSPEFRPGDRVQAFNGENWVDCRYLRWNGSDGRHVVQYEGCTCSIDPEMIRPGELGACGRKARFKPGDRVQYRVTLPSVSDRIWVDAVYACLLPDGRSHAVKTEKLGLVSVEDEDIRPAPRAEGCEELVQQDAPRTKEELYDKIIVSNPATYGHPHTPTGEELAEMAGGTHE